MTSDVRKLLNQFADEHAALHRSWTAAVGTPGYTKAPWLARDRELTDRYSKSVRALGYDGPLIV